MLKIIILFWILLMFTPKTSFSVNSGARIDSNLTVNGTIFLKDGSPMISSTGLLADKGTWSSDTNYFAGDVVQINGNSYVCKTANQGQTIFNDIYWSVLAAQGKTGVQGPTGPAGATGAGLSLIDNNSVVLGKVLYASPYEIYILTPGNYILEINWDATFTASTAYAWSSPLYYTTYSGGVCGGAVYVVPGTNKLTGKTAYWSASKNSFMIPATLDANNMTNLVSFTAAAHDYNATCNASSQTLSGVLLTPITRTALGLPDIIVPPFKIQ